MIYYAARWLAHYGKADRAEPSQAFPEHMIVCVMSSESS